MFKHRYSRFFPILFILADLFCLNLAFFFADLTAVANFNYRQISLSDIQILLNLLWIIVFFSVGLQEIDREQNLLALLNKTLSALVVNLAVVFGVWFAVNPPYSREHLFYTYLFFTIAILSWRSIWHYTIRYYRTKGFNIRNVVFVGGDGLAREMINYINENKEIGYNFLGVFDDNNLISDKMGNVNDLENYIKKFYTDEKKHVDIIFCDLYQLGDGKVNSLINIAENHLIKVKILSQFSRLASQNLSIQNYGSIAVLDVNAIPLDSKPNQIAKRIFDILFSGLVILLILIWLVPLIGLLIKMESKGPLFFRQLRHGRGNRPFYCLKFRTMVLNEASESKQATKNDNRVTRVGAILRKTSIDEIPQFFNVFMGEMSVVGPRPHPIKLNETFQPNIEKFWQRHAVKPGITGLAQAKGFRGETSEFSDMSGRVKLDRFYIKNWSLVLDFKIIILTIASILRGSENAY